MIQRESIILKISEVYKQHVWEFTKDNNIGNRNHFNGTREQQFIGLIGEHKVREMMGMPGNEPVHYYGEWHLLPEIKSIGFDGGFDIELIGGERFDVKTMTRNVQVQDHHEHNIVASQIKYDVDYYIFCSLNKKQNTLSVDGYVSKFEFLKWSNFYEAGKIITRDNGSTFKIGPDTFSIETRYLHDPQILDGLGNAMAVWNELNEGKLKHISYENKKR